jgi:monovalent cation:H+ antiporter, CPA1 family
MEFKVSRILMQVDFQTVTFLLLIAAVVAMLTKRLRLPYSAGLVAAGIGLAAVPFVPRIAVTKDLIYTGLLPPLLFEAAYQIQWDRLRRNAPVLGVLVTLGVIISTAATAAGMHFITRWPWMPALIFGSLIAATDPVAVIATFREAKAHGRLALLVEAESLLNDGTASVVFAVVVALATGLQLTGSNVFLILVLDIGGGILCGAAVGAGSLLLSGQTDDYLVEITCTTVAAYGSFLLADSFGMSGVLATIVAGLIMRNYKRPRGITPRGREAIEHFWEYAAFVANSFVFLLIGTQQRDQKFLSLWGVSLAGVAIVLVARALAVYPCCIIFARSQLRVSAKHQFALVWGGMRGALALALALSLPRTFAYHDQIVTVSLTVVAFSIFVQGLTMAPLLRKIGEITAKASAVPISQEEAARN